MSRFRYYLPSNLNHVIVGGGLPNNAYPEYETFISNGERYAAKRGTINREIPFKAYEIDEFISTKKFTLESDLPIGTFNPTTGEILSDVIKTPEFNNAYPEYETFIARGNQRFAAKRGTPSREIPFKAYEIDEFINTKKFTLKSDIPIGTLNPITGEVLRDKLEYDNNAYPEYNTIMIKSERYAANPDDVSKVNPFEVYEIDDFSSRKKFRLKSPNPIGIYYPTAGIIDRTFGKNAYPKYSIFYSTFTIDDDKNRFGVKSDDLNENKNFFKIYEIDDFVDRHNFTLKSENPIGTFNLDTRKLRLYQKKK